MIVVYVSLSIFLAVITEGWAADDEHLHIQVLRHQPCRWKEGAKWNQSLIFPSDRTAPLQEDGRDGCYKIGGIVNVTNDIIGDIQIHLELKYNIETREKCYNPDSDGCGGFGSCLYCDACNEVEGKQVLTASAQLEQDGKPVDCRLGLKRGVHRNVYLHFCLPSRSEFLKSHGLSADVWDNVVGAKEGEKKPKNKTRLGVFVIIRLFNSRVNQLLMIERALERKYRRERPELADHEDIPAKYKSRFPFERLLQESAGFVACHKVFGNLYTD